jgi:hypothetical protein
VRTLAEDGLVSGREGLGDGLLDQAIKHHRNAKGAGLPLAFRDLNPPASMCDGRARLPRLLFRCSLDSQGT